MRPKRVVGASEGIFFTSFAIKQFTDNGAADAAGVLAQRSIEALHQ
jgi:hypothetical protein